MKTHHCLGLILSLVCAAACVSKTEKPAASGDDVLNGAWAVAMNSERNDGIHRITLTIIQEGERLTGTWSPDTRPHIKNPIEGSVRNRELRFDVVLSDGTRVGIEATLRDDGTLEGIHGTNLQRQLTFTATRKAG